LLFNLTKELKLYSIRNHDNRKNQLYIIFSINRSIILMNESKEYLEFILLIIQINYTYDMEYPIERFNGT
jgi:hypothetical protein